MKKTLLIAAAVAMSFVACSKEEIQTVGKGMTLSANVADDNTKATINKNSETEKWNFSWEANDAVAVTAPGGDKYNFVKPETGDFKCEVAEPAAGEWTAVYPANYNTDDGINFAGQDGSLKCALAKYYMTGSCESDGSATLSMKMEPKCAILKVKNNASSDKTIYLMNGYNEYYNKIISNGVATKAKGGKTESLLATVAAYSESYIAIPVPTEKVKVNYGGTNYTKFQKISAGKVYNVTIGY